ncbi:MAG TPA: polymer-forming cytoskeletal protein [Bryobacteraceae bacterium]|jgi:cytoskeletal protein CcmA (bactofilin family)|nr:polymer-forming cytoskeletal protein [Bryobacteraceae bacterium]
MWNKDQTSNSPSAPAPAATPARAASPEPVASAGGARIGSTMKIKGDVISREDMTVDGEVEGKLEARDRLTIGASGKVDATIKASEVVVGGTVKGNVDASQRIVLRKGANLVGDVKTAGIVIEDGAYFRGGIDIARPENGR